MTFFRPKSVRRLVLIGFSGVALPLIISLVYATLYVDRSVDQSQQAVFQAVQATKGSLMLMEQIKGMERSARQFILLGDEAFFRIYEKTHQELQSTANELQYLPMGKIERALLLEFLKKETVLFELLRSAPANSEQRVQGALALFTSLTNLAESILSANRSLIDRKIDLMTDKGKETQKILLYMAVSVIAVAIFFIKIFGGLITNPIRQLDQAIRNLADNTFSSEISISGPKDLVDLGKRLEWLRIHLNDLEAQKSQFLRHLSHNLKTPLTATRTGAELLVDEVLGSLNDEQRKVARILNESSLKLQKMIENLLNFSEVLERHTVFTLSPVSLNQLVEKVVADHQLVIMARKIIMDLNLSGQTISGDEEKLTVVIDNLVSNAVKFSPDGGKISILLSARKESVILDVIDSGPGIDENEKGRVFEPFFQGKHVPKGVVDGTGIGLSLVKEYVMAHRGTINILEDDREGGHFRITLPFNPAKATI